MKKEQIKTAKFGGSSLADAAPFRKVKEIVEADPARRYIVPSAPGRRSPEDEKVTDLLYRCYEEASSGADYHNSMEKIRKRYQDIIDELSLNVSLDAQFEKITQAFLGCAGEEYAASRGEYLNAILLAAFLGYEFVEAARWMSVLTLPTSVSRQSFERYALRARRFSSLKDTGAHKKI